MKSDYHMIMGLFHSDVTVVYQNGLPVISVRLPSRRERCQFTLKPISDSVGVFLRQLQEEDRGIDRVAIYSPGEQGGSLARCAACSGDPDPRGDALCSAEFVWTARFPSRTFVSKEEKDPVTEQPSLPARGPVSVFFNI